MPRVIREKLSEEDFNRLKSEVNFYRIPKSKPFFEAHKKAISEMRGMRGDKEELIRTIFDVNSLYEPHESYLENIHKLLSEKYDFGDNKRRLNSIEAYKIVKEMQVNTWDAERGKLFQEALKLPGDFNKKVELINAIKNSMILRPFHVDILSSDMSLKKKTGILNTLSYNRGHPFVKENLDEIVKGKVTPTHTSAFEKLLKNHFDPSSNSITIKKSESVFETLNKKKLSHENIIDFMNELRDRTLYLSGKPDVNSFSLELSDKFGRKYSVKGDHSSFEIKNRKKVISPKKIKGLKKVLKLNVELNHESGEVKQLLKKNKLLKKMRAEQNKKKMSQYPPIVKRLFNKITETIGKNPLKGEIEAPEISINPKKFSSGYNSTKNSIAFVRENVSAAEMGEELWHWAHDQYHKLLVEEGKMEEEEFMQRHLNGIEYIGRMGGLWAEKFLNDEEEKFDKIDEKDYVKSLCHQRAVGKVIEKLEYAKKHGRLSDKKRKDAEFIIDSLSRINEVERVLNEDDMTQKINRSLGGKLKWSMDGYIESFLSHRSQDLAEEKFDKEFKNKELSKVSKHILDFIKKPKSEVLTDLDKIYKKMGKMSEDEFHSFTQKEKQKADESIAKDFRGEDAEQMMLDYCLKHYGNSLIVQKAFSHTENADPKTKLNILTSMITHNHRDLLDENLEKIYKVPAKERPKVIKALSEKGEKALHLIKKFQTDADIKTV